MIIAGISISAITGTESTMEKGQKAKETQTGKSHEEQIRLFTIEEKIDMQTGDVSFEQMCQKIKNKISNLDWTKEIIEEAVTDYYKVIKVVTKDDWIVCYSLYDNGDVTTESYPVAEKIENPAARIGSKEYAKLKDAVGAVNESNNPETIVLLKDVSENITIKENQNIILQLGDKTLRGKMTNNGTIEIQGGNVFCSSKTPKNAIVNNNHVIVKYNAAIKSTSKDNAAISNKRSGRCL